MVRWHWVYRDFLRAYAACPSEAEWLRTYEEYYLSPHQRLLRDLHFGPRGFATEDLVIARMVALGYSSFASLAEAAANTTAYERAIKTRTHEILRRLRYTPESKDVYVIVGLNCTNIYSLVYHGRLVTVVCLEFVAGRLSELDLLLSHECHHWAREVATGSDLFSHSLGERLVTEGLAAQCSAALFPGHPAHEYCFVPQEVVTWVYQRQADLDALLPPHLVASSAIDALFARHPSTRLLPTMPPRVGYVYGYLVVGRYLQATGTTALEQISVPWDRVFPTR